MPVPCCQRLVATHAEIRFVNHLQKKKLWGVKVAQTFLRPARSGRQWSGRLFCLHYNVPKTFINNSRLRSVFWLPIYWIHTFCRTQTSRQVFGPSSHILEEQPMHTRTFTGTFKISFPLLTRTSSSSWKCLLKNSQEQKLKSEPLPHQREKKPRQKKKNVKCY